MIPKIDRYVLLGDGLSLAQLFSLMAKQAHAVGAVAFHKQTVYYETILGFKMRRNLKVKLRKFINEG